MKDPACSSAPDLSRGDIYAHAKAESPFPSHIGDGSIKTAASHLRDGWATFVFGFEVKDPDGKEISSAPEGRASWRLEEQAPDTIHVSYDVDPTAHQTPDVRCARPS
jgi:hypothetical protein